MYLRCKEFVDYIVNHAYNTINKLLKMMYGKHPTLAAFAVFSYFTIFAQKTYVCT